MGPIQKLKIVTLLLFLTPFFTVPVKGFFDGGGFSGYKEISGQLHHSIEYGNMLEQLLRLQEQLKKAKGILRESRKYTRYVGNPKSIIADLGILKTINKEIFDMVPEEVLVGVGAVQMTVEEVNDLGDEWEKTKDAWLGLQDDVGLEETFSIDGKTFSRDPGSYVDEGILKAKIRSAMSNLEKYQKNVQTQTAKEFEDKSNEVNEGDSQSDVAKKQAAKDASYQQNMMAAQAAQVSVADAQMKELDAKRKERVLEKKAAEEAMATAASSEQPAIDGMEPEYERNEQENQNALNEYTKRVKYKRLNEVK